MVALDSGGRRRRDTETKIVDMVDIVDISFCLDNSNDQSAVLGSGHTQQDSHQHGPTTDSLVTLFHDRPNYQTARFRLQDGIKCAKKVDVCSFSGLHGGSAPAEDWVDQF